MELPKCKACGQSVLDDDAADCPFCGASMKTGKPSGKPGAKPAAATGGAKAASKPASTATAAAGAKSAAKPAAAAAGRAAPPMGLDDDDDDFRPPPNPDDDPFELEKKSQGLVIPLKAAPAKGLTLKLVCPMCETVGYASPKAEGANVRCANPKCLVPIFPGPKPKVEAKPAAAAPPPAPKKSRAPLIAGVLVGLLAAGAAGAYFAGLLDGSGSGVPKKVELSEEDRRRMFGGEDDTPTVENPENPDGDKPPVKGSTGPTPAELRKKAFEALVATSRDQTNERDKASSRAMAAEIAAASGDLADARQHADQLVLRAKNLGFYAIPPLTDIGWKELQAGRRDAAVALADKELAAAAALLPAFGRKTAEVAPQRAALLVALGRADEAAKIVESLQEQIAFAAVTVPFLESTANGTFDFAAAARREPILPWIDPHSVAVTKLLCLHGQWDAALDWARRGSNVETKVDNLCAWAEAAVAAGPAGKAPIGKLESALGDLPPAGKSRVFATMAQRHADAGRREQADAALQTAKQLLAEVEQPAAPIIPGTKALLALQPVDPVPFRSAAHAAAAVAQAESALKQESAPASLDAALAYARGIGPSLAATRDLLASIDESPDAVRDRIKSELKLTSADEARRALSNYRQQITRLNDAAKSRLDVQSRVLSALARTDLRDAVWEAIRKGEGGEGNDREPYLESTAPWELLVEWTKAGVMDKATEVRTALEASQAAAPAEIVLADQIDARLKAGRPADAAALAERSTVDKSVRERIVLVAAARLVNQGAVDSALAFLRGFKDSVLREALTAHTATLASRAGHGAKIQAATETKNLPSSDKAALIRGYLMGTQSPAP